MTRRRTTTPAREELDKDVDLGREGSAAPREALVPQPLDDAGHGVGDVEDPVVADLGDEVAAGLPSVRAALKQVNSHRRAHLFRPSLPENGPKR